jgi:class 3 adenylate cyclase
LWRIPRQPILVQPHRNQLQPRRRFRGTAGAATRHQPHSTGDPQNRRHHPASTPNGHCGQPSRSPRLATASYRPASCASRTARALAADLRRLPVDFGIGVSAGPVFADNIGAENRYEYTVVGDAVNEAARLADRAKDFEERVLCSAAAIDRADETERRSWSVQGSEMLRGRSRLTQISAPARGG